MTPDTNRAGPLEAPRFPNTHFLLRCLVLLGYTEADSIGSSDEDDYSVRDVKIWTELMIGGIICYVSEQRQTRGTGPTIISFK